MNSPFTDFMDVAYEGNTASVSEVELIGPFSEVVPDMEGELTETERLTAMSLNAAYMISLKWASYIDLINEKLRAITGTTAKDTVSGKIDHSILAKAIDRYQVLRGLKPTNKGVMSIGTWSVMQGDIGLHDLNNYKSKINIEKAQNANTSYESKGTWGSANRNTIISMLASNGVTRFDLPLDSIYFAAAVAKFQSLNGLGVDGMLGPTTFGRLKTKTPPTPQVPITPASPQKSRWHQFIKNTNLCAAEPFVYGKDTYKAIVEAIRTANKRGHYIYILGWMFDINFPLIPNESNTTMKALLKEAADKGVEIRIMIWNNPYYNSEIAKTEAAFNGTGNSLVIRDNVTYGSPYVGAGLAVLRNRIAAIPSPIRFILDKMDIEKWEEIKKYSIASNEGSHHEKVIIVKNDEQLIGFCGGIDINPDRIGAYITSGMPRPIIGFDENGLPVAFPSVKFEPLLEILHDVHCRVKGHGAYSLLQRFLWRWNHFKASRGSIYPLMNNKLVGEGEKSPPPSSPGKGISNVKILHTYNSKNGADYGRSIFNTVRTAIQNAEKSVHFECQYMISVEIAKMLHDKVMDMEKKGKKFYVTILTQEDKFAASDIAIIKRMRKAFMSTLYGNLPRTDERIKVWMLDTAAPFPAHHKVHSKLYIIDRELAIIGSANCSRRSMTYDSETAAVIFNDPGYTNDFITSLETKYDKISHWKTYWPDHDVKDIDEKLIEGVDKHLNSLSITSVITGLLAGIGGKMVLTNAIQALASALPELLRPIMDPYDERTKIEPELNEEVEQGFAILENAAENVFELTGETGNSSYLTMNENRGFEDLERNNPFVTTNTLGQDFDFANQEANISNQPAVEGELSSDELGTAIRLNAFYQIGLGWVFHLKAIDDYFIRIGLFRFTTGSSRPEVLAPAVAKYQEMRNLKPTNKGALAIGTWSVLQKDLGLHNLSNNHGINIKRAQIKNSFYEKELWGGYKDVIFKNLVREGVIVSPLPLDSTYFALAIAEFQAKHPPLKVDGILGPKTDNVLRTGPITEVQLVTRTVDILKSYTSAYINALGSFSDTVANPSREEIAQLDASYQASVWADAGKLIFDYSLELISDKIPLLGDFVKAVEIFREFKEKYDNYKRERERMVLQNQLKDFLVSHRTLFADLNSYYIRNSGELIDTISAYCKKDIRFRSNVDTIYENLRTLNVSQQFLFQQICEKWIRINDGLIVIEFYENWDIRRTLISCPFGSRIAEQLIRMGGGKVDLEKLKINREITYYPFNKSGSTINAFSSYLDCVKTDTGSFRDFIEHFVIGTRQSEMVKPIDDFNDFIWNKSLPSVSTIKSI